MLWDCFCINSSLGGLSFAQDADGKWGYKVGADAVIPFKSGIKLDYDNAVVFFIPLSGKPEEFRLTISKTKLYLVVANLHVSNGGSTPNYKLNGNDITDCIEFNNEGKGGYGRTYLRLFTKELQVGDVISSYSSYWYSGSILAIPVVSKLS